MAKLKFYYSSMKAGKSLDLLRIYHNYTELKKSCILLKPSIDCRWAENKITSRIGVSAECTTYEENQNLYDLILNKLSDKEYSAILIDEIQFSTPDQIWQLSNIVDWLDLPIFCFGLRTDYNGNLFPGSSVLLGIADEVIEIKTLCHCSKKATMNLRVDKTTNKIIKNIGDGIHLGDECYIPVCRKHWSIGDVGE